MASSILKYFIDGTVLDVANLLGSLRSDLDSTIERINLAVSSKSDQLTSNFMQSVSNQLKTEVNVISQEEGQPFFDELDRSLGSCEWFLSVFKNYKRVYPNASTSKVLVEVAKEFEDGVGVQPAFLQKFFSHNQVHDALINGLKLFPNCFFKWNLGNENLTGQNDDVININELGMIQQLDGEYLLCINYGDYGLKHTMALIVENKNCYLFDINFGLVRLGNDVNETLSFLEIFNFYSPRECASRFFLQQLNDLSLIIGNEKTQIIRQLIPVIKIAGYAPPPRNNGPYCSSLEIMLILSVLESNNISLTITEKSIVIDMLFARPTIFYHSNFMNGFVELKKCENAV